VCSSDLVGARWEESSATGVDGDQQDNSLVGAGAAYVFVRNGTTWSQQAYLKASNTEGVDYFGSAVAISDDLAIISAPLEDSASPGVNGDETDNGTYLAGAAYVFARNGSTWSQEAYLKPSSPEEYGFFGYGVAASGETVVVGEPSDPRGSGEAHVFVRDDTGWSEESCLPWTDPPAGNYFGRAVDIEGDLLVVGSVRAYGNAGSAAVFTRQGSDWTPGTRLRAANADPGDSFGNSTAILSETTVVVGARLEDSGATGVNGDPTDNSVSAAGAVYVFDLDPQEIGTRFCTPAVPNSSGQPGTMRTFGRVQTVESNLTLAAENLPTNSNVGYFIMGTGTNTFTPPGSSGPICVTPGIKRFLPPVSNTAEYAGGFVRVVGTSGPVSSWITPGSTWSFQAWHRDSAASTSNMTDAVSVTFQ
jgi:hypothetical protein